MPIPRIIHQTWRDADLPAAARTMTATWRLHHPEWIYRLWTDEDNRDLIRRHHPDLLTVFDGYEHPIQRADAARYAYLYQYGGLYVDLDFECFRPVDRLLAGRECVLGVEPDSHARIHGRDRIIGNAWMAAAPRHPLLAAVINELRTHRTELEQVNDRILDTTGPFMLTRVVNAYRRLVSDSGVTILASEVLYPLSMAELEQELTPGVWSTGAAEALSKAYAVHHFSGTWWKGTQE